MPIRYVFHVQFLVDVHFYAVPFEQTFLQTVKMLEAMISA